MLVASLALAVGLAIFDLTIRELDLSGTTTQSQYAIYAADTGAECALYWDVKSSSFGTSSTSVWPSSDVDCNGADVAAAGTPPATFSTPQTTGNGWSAWSKTSTASAATTTFYVTFAPQPYCVKVEVAKNGNPAATTIISHGYNTCTGGTLQLERALQVNY